MRLMFIMTFLLGDIGCEKDPNARLSANLKANEKKEGHILKKYLHHYWVVDMV